MKYLLFSVIYFASFHINAQFAPAAGMAGSSALPFDSACFVAWGKACKVQLGYKDISKPDSGLAAVGDSLSAIGAAKENGVLSLGDGGIATISFYNPIIDGTGWDFAVFENTFLDSFLELAFVEVSSDGKRFVRFVSESLTDTTKQTGAFGYTQPTKVNNLAGKYVVGFGTPFNLEELKDSAGLDVNSIKYVRIIDVVGSMNPNYATRDSRGRKINDPWPTRFPSSGFDLDAVGVIHQNLSANTDNTTTNSSIKLWPNPVNTNTLQIQSTRQGQLFLYDISGRKIAVYFIQNGFNSINLSIPTGMYQAKIFSIDSTFVHTEKIIVN